MRKTKTVSKPAAKPAARARTKAKTLFYSVLLEKALAGEMGGYIKLYYQTAVRYHTRRGTVFPRPENAGVRLLDHKDAEAYLKSHERLPISNRDPVGRRLFDEMMAERLSV